MPNEVLANEVLAPLPEVVLSEPDYRAFCAALEASARGRAFLAEYARRNRHADTETVLAALDRLEALVRSQSASTEADRIRQELHALLTAMRGAQPIIEASAAAIKATKLAGLIGFVRHRIESIVAPMHAQSPLPPEVAALVLMDEVAVEVARSHLAVVPRTDEPELPIPAPAAGPPPAIALVPEAPAPALEVTPPAPEMVQPEPAITPPTQEATRPAQEVAPPAPDIIQRSAAVIPEVNLFDGSPVKAAVVEPAVAEAAVVATVVTEAQDILPAPSHTPLIPAHSPPRSQSGFALAKQGAGIQVNNRNSEDVDSGSPLARGRAENPAPMETTLAVEIAATPPPPVFELTLPPPAVKRSAAPASTPVDPLAHIMTLSDEERIALFS